MAVKTIFKYLVSKDQRMKQIRFRLFVSNFRILVILIGLLFISADLSANLRLASVFGNNMVLQRNTEVKIWGWGDPGEKVSVKADWMKTEPVATVAPDGSWQVKLLTSNAGGPYKMTICQKNEIIRLKDIMLGEVWVCSGQSNMDFTIRMFGGWDKTYPLEKDELLKHRFPSIRLFTVGKDTSSQVSRECTGEWKKPDTSSVAEFSATAWFFGVELSKKLGVPIGLIATAWGGTPAEAWTPLQIIESDPLLEFYRNEPNKNDIFPSTPSILYNTMIAPITNFGIRGVIWYQGESNVNDADTYSNLFPAMIEGWRQAWGIGNFPFYFAQIAPFTYERPVVGALLREAQLKCLSVPNSGMAVTMDIAGDVTDIHPKNKQEVGKRLALWALSGTYGFEDIECSGPVYSGYQKEGKEIRIKFDYADKGLVLRVKGKDPSGFFIAGDDRHFIPAKVQVDGNTILVRSDKVKDPVAVRYAFSNTSTATLFNESGLPASSFRTDDWPLVTDPVFMKPAYDPASGTIVYTLSCLNPKATLHYTLDRSEPSCSSPSFDGKSIAMMKPGLILARACVNGTASESIGSWEVKPHKGMASKVSYQSKFAARYSAGGEYGLVDGVNGSLEFYDGAWQGFEGDDLDITLDLGQLTMVRKISMHFLSDTNSWIFLPKHIEVKVSKNGNQFEEISRFDNIATMTKSASKVGKQIVTLRASAMRSVRYIRIKATNIGVCPPGHPGAGDKAWLFIDEVELE